MATVDARALTIQARLGAGLTQRALSARSGVPQPAISRIERGSASPRVDTLDRLLAACDRDVEVVPRPGAGVDRTLIRQMLDLSLDERARLVVRQWEATRAFDRSAR
jgi:transcriptional regulator with XRE-family HTH domain